MNEADLTRIERALAITLPESYRRAVLDFPLPAFRGNTDTELWDDAEAIIRFNLELRQGASGGAAPWPTHMFALGHAGDGSPSALDLRTADAPRWWVEKRDLTNSGSGQTHDSFEEWLPLYMDDLAHDLESDGIEAGGTAKTRKAAREADDKVGEGCFWTVVVIGLILIVAALLFRWLY